jgi:predicted ATPase
MLKLLADDLALMRAVGAFRHRPERSYEFQGHGPSNLFGLQDSNVVDALIEASTGRGKRNLLLSNVNRWLKKVGRVRLMRLTPSSKSRRIFELRLKDIGSGRWANFADVGFGIGQALPVLVEGLRTPKGGLFLVQEPEIHLHPDAQLAMADFLIDLARSGVCVVAETHSEHILLRARHAILESAINGRTRHRLTPQMVSIIHVESDDEGGSHARNLPLNELAQVKNWPKDFMEEATEERMALLGSMAKRAEAP